MQIDSSNQSDFRSPFSAPVFVFFCGQGFLGGDSDVGRTGRDWHSSCGHSGAGGNLPVTGGIVPRGAENRTDPPGNAAWRRTLTHRLVRLRRRNASLHARYRAADAAAIDELAKGLSAHVTLEADRVISALTSEVRAVGQSVEAVHKELCATRQEVCGMIEGLAKSTRVGQSFSCGQLEDASHADKLAAIAQQQVALANEKRQLVAVEAASRREAAAAKAKARKESLEARTEERKRSIVAKAEARKRKLDEEAERREAAKPLVEPPPRP